MKRRRFRFRLTTRLIAVLCISVPLSWFFGTKLHHKEQERRVVSRLRARGALVFYTDWAARHFGQEPPPGPAWLREILGEDFFMAPDFILCMDDHSVRDADLDGIEVLSELTGIALDEQDISDAGLPEIATLEKLTLLYLKDTQVTDAGLAALKPLRGLDRLELEGTRITGAGLKHLEDLPKLRQLSLARTQVTDEDLRNLIGLKSLEWLDLSGTQVTADGVRQLIALPRIDTIRLKNSPAIAQDLGDLGELVGKDGTYLLPKVRRPSIKGGE